jgi:hypothetical protein
MALRVEYECCALSVALIGPSADALRGSVRVFCSAARSRAKDEPWHLKVVRWSR